MDVILLAEYMMTFKPVIQSVIDFYRPSCIVLQVHSIIVVCTVHIVHVVSRPVRFFSVEQTLWEAIG